MRHSRGVFWRLTLILLCTAGAVLAAEPAGREYFRQTGVTAEDNAIWRELVERIAAANALYAADTLEARELYWLIAEDADSEIERLRAFPLPETKLVDALRLLGAVSRRNADLNGGARPMVGNALTAALQKRIVARQNRLAATLNEAHRTANRDQVRSVARAADGLADSLRDAGSLINYQVSDALRMTAIFARHAGNAPHFTVVRDAGSEDFLRLRDTLDRANQSYAAGDLDAAAEGYQQVASQAAVPGDTAHLADRVLSRLVPRLRGAAEGNLALLRWRPFVDVYNTLSDSLNRTNLLLNAGQPFAAISAYRRIALASDSLLAGIELTRGLVAAAGEMEPPAAARKIAELSGAAYSLQRTAKANLAAAHTHVPDYCRHQLDRARRPGATAADFTDLVATNGKLALLLIEADLSEELRAALQSLRGAIHEVVQHRFGGEPGP